MTELEKFKKLLQWFVRQLRINNGVFSGETVTGKGCDGNKIVENYAPWREYDGFTLDCTLRGGVQTHDSNKNYIHLTDTWVMIMPVFQNVDEDAYDVIALKIVIKPNNSVLRSHSQTSVLQLGLQERENTVGSEEALQNFFDSFKKEIDLYNEGARETEQTEVWGPLEYDPEISTLQWLQLFEDTEIFNWKVFEMLRTLDELGGATCKQLAQRNGNTAPYYITIGWNLGKRIHKKIHCKLSFRENGDTRWWAIPFLGKNAHRDEEGVFKWKLRDNLREALRIRDGRNEMVKYDKNLILHGPPGTGKTYHTVFYAVGILENKRLETLFAEGFDAVLKRYNKYKKEGRLQFVTFHQSFGYEDFIEGIKPEADKELQEIVYKVQPGVFKEFCNKISVPVAREGSGVQIGDNPTIWKVSLKQTGENDVRTDCLENGHIRIGWDEYGAEISEEEANYARGVAPFVHEIKRGDIVLSCYTAQEIDAIGVVTGDYEWHEEYPEYKRLRKVQWLVKKKLNIVDVNAGKTFTPPSVYKLSNIDREWVYKRIEEATMLVVENTLPYVFIIDEINRGNVSKIFGEVITLVEENKRKGAKEAMEAVLPYSKTGFSIPSNVYIIGTMNTADRSVKNIDTALRRRFAFQELMPNAGVLDGVEIEGLNIGKMLRVLNKRIEYLYDREHTVGHAYFLPLKNEPTMYALSEVFRKKILPLLQEYFYDDYEKIRLALGDTQKREETQFITLSDRNEARALFGRSFEEDVNPTYQINGEAFADVSAYAFLQ